jgi:very-short-patch-repair endonuclease
MAPHRQPLTVESNNRIVAEIDIPFVQVRYGVEIDGPHHLLPNVAAADRTRDRALHRLGWVIDRFFWFEVEDRPRWFVTQVQRRLEERARPTP